MAVSHSRGVPPIRTFIFAVVLAASSAGAGAQPLVSRTKNRSEPRRALRLRTVLGTERLLIVDEEGTSPIWYKGTNEGKSAHFNPNVQLSPMMSSLFISFELHSPCANYQAVEQAIAGLGQGIRVHTNFWYLESELGPQDAAKRLWEVMDERDSVIVVDATHHEAGWKHVSMDVSEFIKTHWRPEGLLPAAQELPRILVSRARPQEPALLRAHRSAQQNDEASASGRHRLNDAEL